MVVQYIIFLINMIVNHGGNYYIINLLSYIKYYIIKLYKIII